ncbi:enoyl-CoA hydratase/carnithine racemase [Paraburkholderia sp. BL6669N2]|uniref:enoyl-CoA hydratase/isomerase family protein n=1 Tax=unclassified Paraburkholderia TaxID=2615204 RepID=UPI000D04E072|nr:MULTISPECIES: enoyl-CoA hydratase-related protein [unclassified Paraburkholderia]PRX96935.1 enoyl-CoA hydratase/carnithine racemase [Paraburkholderia sp. BL25I1N1]REG58492.1 enoyl-CoA hydratase/carnithine racemase [Paraburkholderia sp. BL6669N2]
MSEETIADATQIVQVQHEGATAIVTLNYPERRNAFSLKMRETLYARLHHLMHHDEACRAIVLTGAGNTFCAGGDISEMKPRKVLEYRERNQLPLEVFKLMVSGPKAIVAAVEGFAFGAGLSLAAACDMVVTSSTARYASAFVKVGLMPDTGLYWSLAQRVGGGRARELMLSAREFNGVEALQIGFANQVVEPGRALAAALEIASQYAALPAVATAHLKAALATGIRTLDEAIETEVNLQPILRRSREHQEAVSAFMEKRKPVFVAD